MRIELASGKDITPLEAPVELGRNTRSSYYDGIVGQ
jgi:hypothetical protein